MKPYRRMTALALLAILGAPVLAAQERPRIVGVSHMAVKVSDIEKSVPFYRDFLGFAEQYRLNNPQDGTLLLVCFKVSDEQSIEVFTGLQPGQERLHQLAYCVDDAEAMRAYLAKKGVQVPPRVSRGQVQNLGFTVHDPSGYTIEFVQYTPEGWTRRDRGKFLSATRISEHITHGGVGVKDLGAALHFYGDILGFTESWRGGASENVLSWINMKVPGGSDYVELMLDPKVTPHFCLLVPDMEKAQAKLESSPYRSKYDKPLEIRVGKNRKRQLNLYDPDGTRVELMEPNTVDSGAAPSSPRALPADAASWRVGTPIATYWAGPSLTDAVARQMAEGGFNLIWCSSEKDLDIAQRHGLRGQLTNGLLTPAALDDPKRREQLDALIARVSEHPALYAYFIIDEPNAAQFPALGKLVTYLRRHDPAHLAYLNLFPTYATNAQLATQGDLVTAYREYLRRYVEQVKPALISYDHYQFRLKGDGDQYFLNLALIRRAAQEARVPFLNIVQACTWSPNTMRVPNPNELRYLVYSTLAYGAQGISYYVYAHPKHIGSLVSLDGTPGPLYQAVKSYNREFIAIARELQPLRSLGVYHTSLHEPGCEPLPPDASFHLTSSASPASPRGFLLGFFGAAAKPTHVVVVNLDYTAEASTTLVGAGELDLFDATTAQWTSAKKMALELTLPPGGGRLVRIAR